MIKYVSTVLVTIIISMTGFWLMIGREFVTKAEAKDIAISESVVFHEKLSNIDNKIEIYRQDSQATRSVISNNSAVINDLRVELARLTEALRSLERDRDKIK